MKRMKNAIVSAIISITAISTVFPHVATAANMPEKAVLEPITIAYDASEDYIPEQEAHEEETLSEIVINDSVIPVTAFTDETGSVAYEDEQGRVIYVLDDKIIIYGDDLEGGMMII